MSVAGPFTRSVNRFKREAKAWLGPLDEPAVTTLTELAKLLDFGDVSPAMLAQFGLTYRSLLKRQPTSTEPEDEFEAALREDAV